MPPDFPTGGYTHLSTLLFSVAPFPGRTASLSRSQRGDADGFKFFEVDELDGLMRDAGFADVKVGERPNSKHGGAANRDGRLAAQSACVSGVSSRLLTLSPGSLASFPLSGLNLSRACVFPENVAPLPLVLLKCGPRRKLGAVCVGGVYMPQTASSLARYPSEEISSCSSK